MKAVLALGAFAAAAIAAPVSAQTAVVPGTASIYYIFGHDGSTGGNTTPDPDSAAVFLSAAHGGQVFTFTATGAINCCGSTPNTGPDGNGSNTSIGGLNGLSSISGNSSIPLVGVFVAGDPFGQTAPAALSFDTGSALGVSPLLDQVFFIGDGHAGYNNPAGAPLFFTAPAGATALYVGTVDAVGFNSTSGYYGDNPGSFSVTAVGSVPEPATWAMMLVGFGMVGFGLRYRRKTQGARVSFV